MGFRSNIRIAAAAIFLCASFHLHALDAGYSGTWYNPAQSGHGVTVEVLSPTLAAITWYTYDGQGNQAWLIGVGPVTGNTITASASITSGMQFGTFNPNTQRTEPWGTLTLTFNSCSSATLAWQSNYHLNGFAFGSGSTQFTRLTGIGGVKCGKRPASGVYIGFVASAANSAVINIVGLLDERGQYAFLQTNGGAVYFGTYSTSGTSISGTGTGYTAPGFTFPGGTTTTDSTFLGQFGERDFITGTIAAASSTSTVSLGYNPAYDRPSSTALIAGNYSWSGNGNTATFSVSAAGNISGSDTTGCQYQGAAAPIDSQFDAYSVTIEFSNCGAANGTYSGVGTITDYILYGDDKLFTVGLRGPSTILVRQFVRQ